MRKRFLHDGLPRRSSNNRSPVLLVKKAKEIRKHTGDERYHAAMELQSLTIMKRMEKILARPFKVLFSEPMLIAITLYMSVSMIILQLTEGH